MNTRLLLRPFQTEPLTGSSPTRLATRGTLPAFEEQEDKVRRVAWLLSNYGFRP